MEVNDYGTVATNGQGDRETLIKAIQSSCRMRRNAAIDNTATLHDSHDSAGDPVCTFYSRTS
jgi:hypothetical protein